jgi:hypothetical protein
MDHFKSFTLSLDLVRLGFVLPRQSESERLAREDECEINKSENNEHCNRIQGPAFSCVPDSAGETRGSGYPVDGSVFHS